MDGRKKQIDKKAAHGFVSWAETAIRERLAKMTQAELLAGLVTALLAFLVGRWALPFSIYPLGLALLCAATDRIGYLAVGLFAAGTFLPLPTGFFAVVVLGTLIVRVLARVFVDLPVRIGGDGRRGEVLEHLRGKLFCEGLYLRMVCSCIAVFTTSLYAIVSGGFRYYDLFGALLAMAVAPVSVLLFSGLFEGEPERIFSGRRAAIFRIVSHLFLAVAVCYSLSQLSPSGIFAAVGLALSVVALFRTAAKTRTANEAATVSHPSSVGRVDSYAASARRLADTLTELSCALTQAGGIQSEPSAADLRLLCDDCFDRLCNGCDGRADCWETRYHTMLDATELMVSALAARGRLTVHDLSGAVRKSCSRTEELVKSVNGSMAELIMHSHHAASAEIFALNYGQAATLLREMTDDGDADLRVDERASAAASARLRALGYNADAQVVGERRKRITVTTNADKSKWGYLGDQLSRACGFPLSELEKGEDGVLCAQRITLIDAVWGSCSNPCEGVCGDVLSVFRDRDNGVLFAVINDGMGSGRDAAVTAQLASLFLQKLLPTGVRTETALRMLNHFLRLGRNRGGAEISTTVDLLALDLITGHAVFLKSGAAPTYVKRGKNIFYLDAHTAPVGILPEFDAKQIDFEARDGDIIVMVSDGVVGDNGECLWLLDFLNTTEWDDPTRLARHIVSDAAERGNTDDLSALVLRVKKK